MTSAQLKELEIRCHKAIQHGSLIGKGDAYATMLMTECGTVDAAPHLLGSPQHLLKIIEAVRDVRSGKKPPKKVESPKKVEFPKKVEPKAEPTKIDESLPEPEEDIEEDKPGKASKKSGKKSSKKGG